MKSPSVRRKILKGDCGREMMRKAECGLNKEHSGAVHLPGRGIPRALLGGPSLLNESCQS